MRVLGIDPGAISAAFAVLDGPFEVDNVGDVPVANRMVDGVAFARLVRQFAPKVAIIEQVSAMPKQGVSSSFRFGMGTGVLRGVIAACAIPLIEVSAGKWKKHFGLDSDAEKSRALAIRRFPAIAADLVRKKDHGRAEALLLALWKLETDDPDPV